MSSLDGETPEGEEEELEEEEDPGAAWHTSSRGPGREDMVANYLPEQNDWGAKTRLELNDPGAVAALRQFSVMFPEVEDLQPVIDEFLFDFLKMRTSIGGASRSEYQRILESMFGGHPDDSKPGRVLAEALAGDLYDDD